MRDLAPLHGCLLGMAAFWHRHSNPRVRASNPCRIGCIVQYDESERSGYLGATSDVDSIGNYPRSWSRLDSETATQVSESDALDDLYGGAIAAFLTTRGPVETEEWKPSDTVRARMDQSRLDRVRARNLLLEIGLQSVQSFEGPPATLIDALTDTWNTDLSVSIDVATELAQGAARQRYVDRYYVERAKVWLSAAERLLHARGVHSNPLLVT